MTYRAVNDPPPWEDILNTKIRLHRNLQTKWIVVQTYTKGKGWSVAGATQSCLLKDVRFVINYSRHRWIVTHQKRHVYAWAEGTLIGIAAASWEETPVPLGCNPFRQAEFYDKRTELPLKPNCDRLAVIDNEVFVSLDACTEVRGDVPPLASPDARFTRIEESVSQWFRSNLVLQWGFALR